MKKETVDRYLGALSSLVSEMSVETSVKRCGFDLWVMRIEWEGWSTSAYYTTTTAMHITWSEVLRLIDAHVGVCIANCIAAGIHDEMNARHERTIRERFAEDGPREDTGGTEDIEW